MGIILLMVAVALFTHSGALMERQKNVTITKLGMRTASGIEFFAGIYFLLAAIGSINT